MIKVIFNYKSECYVIHRFMNDFKNILVRLPDIYISVCQLLKH